MNLWHYLYVMLLYVTVGRISINNNNNNNDKNNDEINLVSRGRIVVFTI